ncbi:glycoside hydrolase/deacetylase [Acephala macrosclerotiorum]|nr:glycoside hydrolase/deacetylase [Acephala macrosclerotiorum]
MRANLISLAFGFAFVGLSHALPTDDAGLYSFLSKRAVSPDNTCGNAFGGANNSYVCDATVNEGSCCSQYGYCGNSTDYCSTGCQSDFGTCSPASTQPGDDTFTCGPTHGDLQCNSGLCCYQAGYCGNTTDYCGAGCQSAFGVCSPDAPPPSGSGTCGPNFGGATCSDNQCCSMAGYCGTTQVYCADPGSCMLGYGRCDSDAMPAGASTQNIPRPLKGPITYSNDIYDCVQDNVVALSYDDGPYNYTPQLLDVLKSFGFHATFFITGNNNGKGEIDTTAPYPDLIKRMIAEGHQVASHTWSHYSLSNITHDLRISQMVKKEMAFNNIIGMWPTYMRPPYSDCTEESGCWADMQALGYHRIQNSKNIVKQALAVASVTDYLSIQYDIVQQSVANLSDYYYGLIQQKGWKGVTVGECLGDTNRSNRSFNGSLSSATSSATGTILPTSLPTKPASSTTTPASSKSASSPISSKSTSAPTSTPATSSKVATPTTTKSSSSPTSTSSCAMKNGSWYGNIPAFTDEHSCQQASVSCYGQTVKFMGGGWQNLGVCTKWTQECFKLNAYCKKCENGGGYDNTGFGGNGLR